MNNNGKLNKWHALPPVGASVQIGSGTENSMVIMTVTGYSLEGRKKNGVSKDVYIELKGPGNEWARRKIDMIHPVDEEYRVELLANKAMPNNGNITARGEE